MTGNSEVSRRNVRIADNPSGTTGLPATNIFNHANYGTLTGSSAPASLKASDYRFLLAAAPILIHHCLTS
jgi:hypothetical protein